MQSTRGRARALSHRGRTLDTMLAAIRAAGSSFGPFLIPLLFLAALGDLIVRRTLAVIQRISLDENWESLASLQTELSTPIEGALLTIACLTAVFMLPGLVLGARSKRARFVFSFLAVATLGQIGLAAVRTASGDNSLVWLQHAVTIAALASVVLLAVSERSNRVRRFVGAFFFAAASLPLAWRLGLELDGGTVVEGGALEVLRAGADSAVLVALFATIAIPIRDRDRVALAIALPFGIALLWIATTRFGETKQVLTGPLGLWLTSLPAWVVAVFLSAGAGGLLAGLVSSWRRRQHFALAASLALYTACGFLPIENAVIVGGWCAVLIAARWAGGTRGGFDSLRELFA